MSAAPRHPQPRRPLLVAVVACTTSLLLPVVASAVGPVPGFPNIPTVPGQQTARFKVVVEGTARATKDEVVTSSDPTMCSVEITSRLEEQTEYRRGKGVLMEFVRLTPGAPVLIQRPGRVGDSSLAVQVTSTRTSRGTARRYGSVPEACPPVTEDLAASPECGKPDVTTANVGLIYQGGLLKLRTPRLGLATTSECGATTVKGGVEHLLFSWLEGTPRQPAPAGLSPAAIFGTRRVLVLNMPSVPAVKGPLTNTLGHVTSTVTETGRNRATVRLIRVP